MEKNFKIELISKGSFIDRMVNDEDVVQLYEVTAYVIRLSPEALNAFISNTIFNTSLNYDTHEEYMQHLELKEKQRETFNRKIAELLEIDYDGVKVTQSVSEVFTVTQILKV